MAMFREHVAVGAIISMVVVVAVYFYALLTDPLLLLFLFGVTVIGSFLPDVDSDSGIPFYLIFGSATLFATGVVLLYTLDSPYASDWRYLTGIPTAALLVFWFIVGGVVKRCTHHRGIFHSIPALAISGVASFLVARHYGLDETTAWIFGGAMAAGYLCHLVLDEVHAGITIDGIPFNVKSSFGSALKLFSDSNKVNLATYLVLAALLFTAFQTPTAEAFYNDSDVIEITGTPPPPPPDEAAEEGNGGNGGAGESGGNGSGGDTVTGGGSSGGSGGAGAGTGSGGSGSSETGSEDDLITELLESGALGGSSDFTESGESGFSSGVVTIIGDKVRSVFTGRSDLRDILDSWKNLRSVRASNAREYGLVAASTALSDENIQQVSFTAEAFVITYRSRGYLLSIFPWRFPVTITIVPQAPEGSRVTVKLPWYRYFVREFFTAADLQDELEGVVLSAAAPAAADSDEKAVLFSAVASHLRDKIGTVSSSIILGG